MNMKSWYRTSRLPRPFYFQEKKITFTPPKKKERMSSICWVIPKKVNRVWKLLIYSLQLWR